MTSCGPNTQPMNYTHMFDFNDINGNTPIKTYSKNSIMDVIYNHPDFTKFSYIIKLAEMDGLLNGKQANFTIFVPSDTAIKYIKKDVFLNMDQGDAKNIVNSSLLNSRIPKELIVDSPAAYFNTLSPQNRLFVTNINEITKLNNYLTVLHFDIVCTNGIIHVVDKLIDPLKL